MSVTGEERARMNKLCKLIQQERKPELFDEYLRQLNDLLDEKRGRIQPKPRET